MATRIAGITIENGGDTTKLQKALKGVDSQLKTTQNNLKDINKLLKLDPGNTELLTQKQQNLQKAISGTKDRLQQLKDAQGQVAKGTQEWDALQREITDGGLFPLFVPAGGMASAPNGTLLGRPIVPIEQAGAVGAKGDILFADLSQYRWIDKSGINAQTSIHVRFLYEETAFRFTYRAGGKSIWKNALPAYKGSTSRSPFVTLAART